LFSIAWGGNILLKAKTYSDTYSLLIPQFLTIMYWQWWFFWVDFLQRFQWLSFRLYL
jgi:hypothetical protein